jgi:hypothetical protein
MTRRPLERANRALLHAIETPPDSGREDRLDELAARIWYLAREASYEPNQAQLERLQHRLDRLAEESHERRARSLRDARRHLATCRRQSKSV